MGELYTFYLFNERYDNQLYRSFAGAQTPCIEV